MVEEVDVNGNGDNQRVEYLESHGDECSDERGNHSSQVGHEDGDEAGKQLPVANARRHLFEHIGWNGLRRGAHETSNSSSSA